MEATQNGVLFLWLLRASFDARNKLWSFFWLWFWPDRR